MTQPRPVVGTPDEYDTDDPDRVPWVLGTHLHPGVGPLDRAPEGSRVCMIEARGFARRKPYHHHKLTLVFAAMRHFRDGLREAGYEVEYVRAETFREGLATYFDRHPDDTLVAMRSPSHRSGDRFRDLVEAAGGDLELVTNELFCSTPEAFDEWTDGEGESDQFRHEDFYRWMRRESGVLMADGEPVGGEWNFDEDNREFPPDDWEAPPVYEPERDDLTREVAAWVADEFDTWGSTEGFAWPVTRADALAALDQFVAERLPEFGPYQDAMRADDPAMAHALLSPAVNVGLVHPWEAVTAIEDAYESREDVPLNSAEGAVRQFLGWREFVRHVYERTMPDLAEANRLGADRSLPDLFWSGDTDMACVGGSVGDVRERGYSHHIQRLMVLSNFATLWGVDPAALNEWFHAAYVDAYHWVTTPNVVEMGAYGSGVFATKPYVASANYVDRMSDYCEGCAYDPDRTTGRGACPLNALYWDFLARNEDELRSNHRMGLVYGHVDDKREDCEMDEVYQRVSELRTMEGEGDL
ncbi:cryptochrome/photolyase family protein [Halosimplex halophilum]|uniref:cryptochrome/photolyase family protein n=1 Tax=Halosimplex halophilum TaxID=2559572 RepID=UPI00107EF7E5|nr:cryptochrome/photolyase family protein [Halosimplex halophilum]